MCLSRYTRFILNSLISYFSFWSVFEIGHARDEADTFSTYLTVKCRKGNNFTLGYGNAVVIFRRPFYLFIRRLCNIRKHYSLNNHFAIIPPSADIILEEKQRPGVSFRLKCAWIYYILNTIASNKVMRFAYYRSANTREYEKCKRLRLWHTKGWSDADGA